MTVEPFRLAVYLQNACMASVHDYKRQECKRIKGERKKWREREREGSARGKSGKAGLTRKLG